MRGAADAPVERSSNIPPAIFAFIFHGDDRIFRDAALAELLGGSEKQTLQAGFHLASLSFNTQVIVRLHVNHHVFVLEIIFHLFAALDVHVIGVGAIYSQRVVQLDHRL